MHLLTNIKKELLLLGRDRVGLLVLFVMPVLLVLVLTLVQDNVFRATGETATRALFVNQDQGELGAQLGNQLAASGALELIEEFSGQSVSVEMARNAVFKGDYQFAIIVPVHFSATINTAAEVAVRSALRGEVSTLSPGTLMIYFDPAVRGVYRTALSSSVQRGIFGLAVHRQSEALVRILPEELNRRLQEQLRPFGAADLARVELPPLPDNWIDQALIELREESAAPQKYTTMPTSVQQNVPAWTLFGMFFIVIPLAGTIVRERHEGTLTRLLTMPVTGSSLLLGKVFAYLVVCLLQFGLMLAVGRFVLPLLGTPVLTIGNAPLALLLVAVSSALAACGYGILVGVIVRSYDQAAIFGAVSVVIAAALGGVMVPVYVMPAVMQTISAVSPLGWGLEAFLDIFVRGGNLASVLPGIAALNGFFVACMLIAGVVFRRWRRGR